MQEKLQKVEKADVTRRRILDAAARLFRRHGYAAVSLRMIADAAKMKAGSVYYHFKSKDEIVIQVLDLGIARVHQAVQKSMNKMEVANDAAELIESSVRAHLISLHDNSNYTSANVRIYGQVPKKIQRQNMNIRDQYEALWDEILTRAKSKLPADNQVDIRTYRLLVIGCLNATLEWFDPKQGSIKELAEHYSRYLLGGFQGLGKK